MAADEPLIFLLGFFLGVSIPLLQKSQELFFFSIYLGKIVIGEFAPLLFGLPFDFLPFPFQARAFDLTLRSSLSLECRIVSTS